MGIYTVSGMIEEILVPRLTFLQCLFSSLPIGYVSGNRLKSNNRVIFEQKLNILAQPNRFALFGND